MFTEGVASRLGQHRDRIDLELVDSRDSDCLAKIREARPAVIVLEADDENIERFCPLGQILAAAPEVKLFRLDPGLDRIHVVTGELKSVNEGTDLISMLLPPD
jgi:hypothetical protein